jgi:pro-sigmaK processing inhibitor BofA
MIDTIILILLGLIILVVLWRLVKSVMNLVINSIMGIILLLAVNFLHLFGFLGKTDIPINIISIIVCALAGIPGAILLVILHIAGLY